METMLPMTNNIAAIDCDLRRMAIVFNDGRSKQLKWPWLGPELDTLQTCQIVLFEIASAVDYTDSKATAHNKRRWTIFNVATASMLHERIGDRLLVAPSHVWTKGHKEKVRQSLAECHQPNHDLREAEAMLWFYFKDPNAWVPFSRFLAQL